jgi:hypothetical protein
LTDCREPLEAADVEALACASEPVVRPDAAAHAFRCAPCAARVASARELDGLLAGISAVDAVPADLADRVLRLRPFSRAERRFAVWRAALLLLAAMLGAGTSLVAGIAGPREQVGFAAAFLASAAGVLRAGLRWLGDLTQSTPEGLSALSQLLAPTSAGLAAMLLLVPAGFALSRVLSRSFARR